ncbi:hypothetical protein ACEWY4_009192 [Coilia grayii]|uniref:G-protein coupled receptors family 1 profile domain-containing protein n=1 Tax=Coilia grayii TaxID=363190 RepID=A0ABD1K6F1_9TELE
MGLTKGVENPVMLCFPLQNSSCIKGLRSDVEYILLYAILLVVSSLTVFLNLLVIISVLHFKQLHTPTNLLILSLAVADFLMGLVVIPVDGRTFIETCWYFGDFLCTVFPVVMYTIFSGSLTNIFLISLDRYIAVMDPLQYKVRVTNKKVVLSVLLGWLYAFIYALVILNKHLQHPKPRTMNTVTVRLRSVSKAIVPQKSETKAAKTLGGLIAIYFLCWTPYFVVSLTAETLPYNPAVLHVIYWLLYINSCINPLMYALFYPWFRISVKHILTLSILHSSSSYLNVVPHRQ